MVNNFVKNLGNVFDRIDDKKLILSVFLSVIYQNKRNFIPEKNYNFLTQSMIRNIFKPINSQAFKSLNRQLKYKYFNQQPPRFDPDKDYYRILDLNKEASENEIKKSYYKMAKQYHPDVNKGN